MLIWGARGRDRTCLTSYMNGKTQARPSFVANEYGHSGAGSGGGAGSGSGMMSPHRIARALVMNGVRASRVPPSLHRQLFPSGLYLLAEKDVVKGT